MGDSSNSFYEELEHTADWAIRVHGQDLNSLFEHAAAAMFELQGADRQAEPQLKAKVRCEGMDLETLLIAWLSELLYLSETNDALYTRFQVRVEPEDEGWRLTAQVQGLPGRGHLAHIKAVTYYDLSVRPVNDAWEATVTFDT